ncbi:hypothetical protein Pelo_6643 [Pelomyxa schiedti]|nr:hypothetical protein Pelo_6643 [Pelomyxa schiedti]
MSSSVALMVGNQQESCWSRLLLTFPSSELSKMYIWLGSPELRVPRCVRVYISSGNTVHNAALMGCHWFRACHLSLACTQYNASPSISRIENPVVESRTQLQPLWGTAAGNVTPGATVEDVELRRNRVAVEHVLSWSHLILQSVIPRHFVLVGVESEKDPQPVRDMITIASTFFPLLYCIRRIVVRDVRPYFVIGVCSHLSYALPFAKAVEKNHIGEAINSGNVTFVRYALEKELVHGSHFSPAHLLIPWQKYCILFGNIAWPLAEPGALRSLKFCFRSSLHLLLTAAIV